MDINEIKAKNAYYEKIFSQTEEEKEKAKKDFFGTRVFCTVDFSSVITVKGLNNLDTKQAELFYNALIPFKETVYSLGIDVNINIKDK